MSALAGDRQRIVTELQNSKQQIEDKTGRTVRAFAYPFSDQGDREGVVRALAGKTYKYSRGGDRGFNNWPFRKNALFAWPLYEKCFDVQCVIHLINYCIEHDVWLILYSHDIEKEPTEFGCTPGYFERVLEYIGKSGVMVKPIGSVDR